MIDQMSSYFMGQYHWQRDMKMDLQKLKESLSQIQMVVEEAEGWQALKDGQKHLLQRLKEAVYEADDLLDEFEYRVMQAQAEEAQDMVSRTASSSLIFVKPLGGQDELRDRLTEIVQKLDGMNKSAERLIQVAGSKKNAVVEQPEISSSRVTSSIMTELEILGRDEEKDEIIRLLQTDDNLESSCTNITVIPIVGDGGIGKTTLAQWIYNDKRIKDRFHHLRMWICVSDNFDKVWLTRKMLEYVSKPSEREGSSTSFDVLQTKLQTELKSKRFLLVLDDVWLDEKSSEYSNKKMWGELLASLQVAARGSKILVTTRMRIVAKTFGVTNPISLKGLATDKTWSLLEKCAFGGENPIKYSELKAVGMQIAERLQGSPLASKVVGSMLGKTRDPMKWEEILKEEISGDVMSVLRLSYQHLPDDLKPCFAYCSIFPKDWRFVPEKLVLPWIAQGYIRPSTWNERPMIDVGMDYFYKLLSRSFFQKVEQDSGIYYIIHDLIHDLAQHVSKDECLRINVGQQSNIVQSIRHVGVDMYDVGENIDWVAELEKRCDLTKLRTLIFFKPWYQRHMDFLPGMIKRLRSLRVLDLSDLRISMSYRMNFPGDLGDLIHLRYLNLSGDWYPKVSESFLKLYHLQVLVATHPSVDFCKSMGKLIRCGKLAHLQVSELKFHVGKKRGYRIGVLKDINVVLSGKLCLLNLEGVGSIEEAVEVELGRKQHIHGLQLEWGHFGEGTGSNDLVVDVGVLEGLQPHKNLRELEIKGFQGTRCPSWLETSWLTNLQTMCLLYCSCLELPPLGHLPSLKHLTISGMKAIKRVGREFYGVRGFPSLEVLEFGDMREWSAWCGADNQSGQVLWMLGNPPAIFPCLRKLRVSYCPKLISFPLFPPTLRDVHIKGTGLIHDLELGSLSSSEGLFLKTSLIPPRALQHDQLLGAIERLTIRSCEEPMPAGGLLGLVCLKELKIERCQELAFEIPEEEEEDGTAVLPPWLESLEMYHCQLTDRLLSRCLHGLTSLRRLAFHDCPALKSLPEDGLPASIEELEFRRCGVPSESLFRCLQCLSHLSKLKITACPNMTSLPSAQELHRLTALQNLEIRCCRGLTSLGGLHAADSLRCLIVSDCVKMKSLPDEGLPASIEELQFFDCGVTSESLFRCLQCLSHLSELMIAECPNVTSLLPFAQVLHRLTALQKLEIHHCQGLTSLEGLHAADSLRCLKVGRCFNVESLPEEGLPASIEHLHLWFCHPALMQQIREKKGPEWDKVAHIPHVHV